MRKTHILAALLVLTLVIAGAAVQAQGNLDPLAEPTFGSTDLGFGFLPDPFEIELASGGFVDASEAVSESCWGYIASVPDFRINWSGEGGDLRIFFVGDGDTTLIINDPSGGWHCNDDFDDMNPLVGFENSAAGQYDIWVGSFEVDTNVFGTLYVTELPLSPTDIAGTSGDSEGALDFFAEPNFGSMSLGIGFTPDPFGVEVLSGGGVDVFSALSEADCSGYATRSPDYSLEWTDDGGDLLRILVVAEGDTTLIVNDPYGDWFCNDDTSGFDPMVEFVNPESGRYDIWIGSFEINTVVPGMLYITELAMTPDDF